VFGLDFMLDEEFRPYLIEVNTNPCFDVACPLLSRLIPHMLNNTFQIVADPLFPPFEGFSNKKQMIHELCPENKFVLVFDEQLEAKSLEAQLKP
jgi:hypothetical protein